MLTFALASWVAFALLVVVGVARWDKMGGLK